jgi:hypothetical protein
MAKSAHEKSAMIKFKGTKDGRTFVGFGITAENVIRLLQGKPILIKGEDIGLEPMDITIVYGPSSEKLIEQMRAQGLAIPPESEWKR